VKDAIDALQDASRFFNRVQLTFDELQPRVRTRRGNRFQVPALGALSKETADIRMLTDEQAFDERAAQESGGAGDKSLHGG
jgi:hypothetical protein